jgi:hypothetical protein
MTVECVHVPGKMSRIHVRMVVHANGVVTVVTFYNVGHVGCR